MGRQHRPLHYAVQREPGGSSPTTSTAACTTRSWGACAATTPCPVNEGLAELSSNLEEVTEDETRKILNGTPDDALLASLQRKLRGFRAVASKEQFPILKRNLSVLLRA